MKTHLNEVRFGLLRRLAEDPTLSQRDLARQMGVSVGRVNYCIRALIEKGEIKVNNFRQSDHKLRYAYVLTPKGLESRARLTTRFLKRKLEEYDALTREIEDLRRDVDELGHAPTRFGGNS